MWLKLTEAKEGGRSVLLNADSIAYMAIADRTTDTYVKIKESDSQNTFYFVKESIEEIYKMLAGIPIMASLPSNPDWEMSNKGYLSYVPSVHGLIK